MKHWPINRQLFAFAALPSFVALLAVVLFSYNEVQTTYNINKERNLQVIKNLMPAYMQVNNTPIDYVGKHYTARLKELSYQWKAYLDSVGIPPHKLNLLQAGKALNMNLNRESVYFVNKSGTVFNTSFRPDSGLNFFAYGSIHKNLFDKVMAKGTFHDMDVVRELNSGQHRKFSYLPASDKSFMIELGVYTPEIDTLLRNAQQSIKKIAAHYPEIKHIDMLYGNEYVVALNRPAHELSQIEINTYREAINQKSNQVIELPSAIEKHVLFLPKTSPTQLQHSAIMLTLDNSVHEKALRDLLIKMLLFFFALVVVIAAMAIGNARWIVRPLRKLMLVVQRIEQGDLTARASLSGSSELCFLSRRINKMTVQIQESYIQLERKVDERTETIKANSEELQTQKEQLEQQNKNLKEAKSRIDRQQEEILAGIRAAERLQRMILPKESDLHQLAHAAFIVNIPKDFVSGDFYWATTINNKIIIALGDCTGHGISGAILSILGNELFNKTVKAQKLSKPSEILTAIDEGLKRALQQNSSLHYKDGMDLAVCAIDVDGLSMEYACANTRMYLSRNEQVEELRGDKNSIGDLIQRSKVRFNNKQVSLQKDDMLYLSSDGFADQFGGASNKKFTRKKLRATLSEISQKPIALQKTLLMKQFDSWKGANFQVDDVLVIGIRM